MDYKSLRNTPGFTNYVPSVNKDINGNISSAELKRYYANIDAQIFFNGEWVEDINDIDWSISQQTMPLFGYNSYIWEDVAQGNRIISGSFVIAFTKPRKVADAIKKGSQGAKAASGSSFETDEQLLLKSDLTKAKVQNGMDIVSGPPHNAIWTSKFDIDIMCGEKEIDSTNNFESQPVHIILTDCYIIGGAQSRMHAGGVAMERYNFMARDITTIQ